MLDFLRDVKSKDFDGFFFIPGEEEDTIRVEGCNYKQKGEELEKSEMGNMYHIILFKQDEEGNPIKQDMFEAILSDPLEYMSNLIPQDWYGLICKKTTTSTKFAKETFDKLSET